MSDAEMETDDGSFYGSGDEEELEETSDEESTAYETDTEEDDPEDDDYEDVEDLEVELENLKRENHELRKLVKEQFRLIADLRKKVQT